MQAVTTRKGHRVMDRLKNGSNPCGQVTYLNQIRLNQTKINANKGAPSTMAMPVKIIVKLAITPSC
ncbi:MAG: hypothetical protein Sw1PiTSA_12590 [Shewanella algae]|uniref:Uncharacterized protein n=1 Tax=Shewanella algae TaxID=38313 RepID=A0AAD1KBJ0_9GAMM|nr:hypothetical protein TUM4442_33610 [Shewanella algae]BCV46418.1 hypothetical protein TUM17379_34360 [Shewanella algae]BCV50882.1 hypothetical protein TUM17382_35750 [Shewanella algae]BCV55199.1 hypothetical protein TUM17383_34460 [Shewanella algae]